MSAQFDLEQQILSCWHVTDDINLLYKSVMERDMSRDEIANVLLGLKSIYELKFNETWDTFEKHIKEYYGANDVSV